VFACVTKFEGSVWHSAGQESEAESSDADGISGKVAADVRYLLCTETGDPRLN
jgi:hypothetical protein